MPIAPILIGMGALSMLGNQISRSQSKKNMELQAEQNAIDRSFTDYWNTKQFNEQAFLNRNAYQIAAADMQKAGFNPAMLSGSPSYQSGSYSSTQGTAPQDTSNTSEMIQNFASQMFGLASAKMQISSSEKVASDNNQTQIDVAEIEADAQKEVAKDRIEADKDIAKSRIEAEKYIAAEKSKNDVFMQNREIGQRIAELNQKKAEFEEAVKRAESASTLAEKKEAREKAEGISREIRGYLDTIEKFYGDTLMYLKKY